MAKDETKRIKPHILAFDGESLAALKSIANYTPSNSAFATVAMEAAKVAMDTAQTREAQALAAAATARDEAVRAEWNFHNLTLGMRDQVIAQYGRESNEAQAVGRKKPSERRAPRRDKPTT